MKLLKYWIGKAAWLGAVVVSLTAMPLCAAALEAEGAAPATGAGGPKVWLTFGLDLLPGLKLKVMGNPLWQYLAFLIYVLLAFYVSKLLDRLIQGRLKKWAAKSETKLDDLILELLSGPVKVIAFVIFLYVGLRLFAWPQWAAQFISNGLKIVVACSLTYVAVKFVDVLVGFWQQRTEATHEGMVDHQLFPIIRKSLKIFVLVVAVLVTSQNLGMNITGLLASLSIGGLAVGLAAQDTLSNLFGAVMIFADKPFRVGDRIQLDAVDGTVEVIGLRSTRVRNLDGYLVTIPNKTMANATIVNVSKRPNIKTVMNIGVTCDTPAERVELAMRIINEIYRPHPKTADLMVSFNKFESSSLNILVVHWWNSTDAREYAEGFQQLNLELKRRFDAEGINFAFPTQTVYLRQDSEWRLADAKGAVK
ncbi:MAG TPA: mechanosensitive ion channel family protein [Candidatus Paceibacterota bacterium]|nr:mechanosensitive ion channel family protein [Verrucomicrobiota bacterium]HSA11292.1 mechanosensitive ion channel family protein [Candidatus Paceibacterota bacterium]